MIIFILMLIDPMIISINNSSEAINGNYIFKNHERLILSNLYNIPNAIITLFIVIYLFLTLIVIVFITKSYQGPLRPSF